MRPKYFYIFLYFLSSCIYSFSQNIKTEPSRSEIFDRMEARAQSLAKRMQEMSGERSQTSDQNNPPSRASDLSRSVTVPSSTSSESVDTQDQIPVQNSIIPENTISETGTTNNGFSVVDDSDDYLSLQSAQELLGDYYISPSLGFVLSSENNVIYRLGSTMVTDNLDNEMGYGVGMKAGIRFDNLFTEVGIKYSSLDYQIYSEAKYAGRVLPYRGDDTLGVLNFNARLGYAFQINDLLSLNGSAGLGLSNRRNTLDFDKQINDSISSNETVLSYDFAFSINYFTAESFLISLGYNYMNVAKISQFEALDLHYFELGMGLNF